MKKKQIPIIVKLLIYIIVFALIGYAFYKYKNALFGI